MPLGKPQKATTSITEKEIREKLLRNSFNDSKWMELTNFPC
jgi:hypothetical protein